MGDFVNSMLDVAFFIFDKANNILVLFPAGVLFFCLCFAVVHRIMRTL